MNGSSFVYKNRKRLLIMLQKWQSRMNVKSLSLSADKTVVESAVGGGVAGGDEGDDVVGG